MLEPPTLPWASASPPREIHERWRCALPPEERRRHAPSGHAPTYANVTATLALFVALGGAGRHDDRHDSHEKRASDHGSVTRSVDPREVWELLQRGEVRVLDLRTRAERRRYGAPPGAIPASFMRHALHPAGEGAVYLCQHAVRSKATLRKGAAEVAGGFVAWRRAGLPVETPR
jgi:rhodanese-related sulfurtransferase